MTEARPNTMYIGQNKIQVRGNDQITTFTTVTPAGIKGIITPGLVRYMIRLFSDKDGGNLVLTENSISSQFTETSSLNSSLSGSLNVSRTQSGSVTPTSEEANSSKDPMLRTSESSFLEQLTNAFPTSKTQEPIASSITSIQKIEKITQDISISPHIPNDENDILSNLKKNLPSDLIEIIDETQNQIASSITSIQESAKSAVAFVNENPAITSIQESAESAVAFVKENPAIELINEKAELAVAFVKENPAIELIKETLKNSYGQLKESLPIDEISQYIPEDIKKNPEILMKKFTKSLKEFNEFKENPESYIQKNGAQLATNIGLSLASSFITICALSSSIPATLSASHDISKQKTETKASLSMLAFLNAIGIDAEIIPSAVSIEAKDTPKQFIISSKTPGFSVKIASKKENNTPPTSDAVSNATSETTHPDQNGQENKLLLEKLKPAQSIKSDIKSEFSTKTSMFCGLTNCLPKFNIKKNMQNLYDKFKNISFFSKKNDPTRMGYSRLNEIDKKPSSSPRDPYNPKSINIAK